MMKSFVASAGLFHLSLLLSLSLFSAAVAEEPFAAPRTPQPFPQDVGTRLVLDPSNVGAFRKFISEELFDAVAKGVVELPTARESKVGWKLDTAWIEASADGARSAVSDEQWKNSVKDRRFPYGIPQVADVSGNEALKLLWNAESLWRAQGAITAQLRINSFAEGKLKRSFGARYARVYPHRLTDSVPATQIFRESLRFLSPAPVLGLTYLSLRSLGDDEDALWLYSPVINKTRQLVGSNRGDAILNTLVTLDDLMVWSGKNELVKVTAIESGLSLIPITMQTDESVVATENDKCLTIPSAAPADDTVATTEMIEFPSIHIPPSVLFVPRPVWKLELSPGDPFALSGRIELQIDKETMLPVVKRVFDQAGKLSRTVVGLFGMTKSADSGAIYPYPMMQVAIGPSAETYATIEFDKVQSCEAFPEGYEMSAFDPARLGPTPEARPSTDEGEISNRDKQKSTR